jgi:hypothetical protein
LLDDLEWAGHASGASCVATGSIHGSRQRIKIKVDAKRRNLDMCQIGTDPAKRQIDGLEFDFAAEGVAVEAEGAEDCCATSHERIED